MTKDEANNAAAGQWVWNREDGYRSLARFASVTALQGLDLHDREAYQALAAMVAEPGADVPRAVREITGRLYERLRSREYPYAAPWGYFNGEQLIRDPVAIHQDAGTCLDLSLLFAAMLAAVGLSAFIVLLEGHCDGNHALVLVDLANTPPGIGRPDEQGSGLRAPVRPEEPTGVFGVRRLVQNQAPVVLAENGLAIEVTAACRDPNATFDEACREGAKQITDRGYQRVHLVDVLACHNGAKGAPLPAHRPAIYPSLPPMPPFTSYKTRAEVTKKLRGATGTVVLLGGSGTGKSMLAHHVAATVSHGSGWFLDASTEQALTVALATQEAQAKGLPAESVDGESMKVLARVALGRLHQSAGPWAVVLDNANEGPKGLRSLPRPVAERGQLLVITTTNKSWDDGQHTVIRLPALPDDEVAAEIDAANTPVEAIAGRPLLIDASRRFRAAAGRWWWTSQPVDADSAPDAFWAAVDGELGHGRVREVAWAISWLPPVRLPAAALTVVAGGQAQSAIDQLTDLGLIDAEGGELTMHRLFRAAVRASALQAGSDAQAVLVGQLLQDDRVRRVMEFAADLDAAREMGDALEAARNPQVATAGLYALGKVFERHGTSADSADWYAKFTARAGWVPGGTVTDDLRLRVVDALAGMARAVGRGLSGSRDERLRSLGNAIPWTEDAERLCRGRADPDLERAATHAKATRGFLLRKRASLEPDRSASGLDFLLQAETALRESYEERTSQFTDAPELDRSQFNLAGLEVRLAQRDHPAKVKTHLEEAWRHYTEVLETRRRRYRTEELEEVVCCINGKAIVLYYQAVMLPGTWAGKTALLRAAAEQADEAVTIRQRLGGITDDPNTAKSLLLQTKISLFRLAVIEAAGTSADRDEAAIEAFRKEREQLLALPGDALADDESPL
jgi:hypothetical protein